jgi:uncharacterized membrane protein YjgN (DUF898 family)
MKNYFSFNLTGKEFFPVWLIIYVLLALPYGFLFWGMRNMQPGEMPSPLIFITIPIVFIAIFFLYFYILKMLIQGIGYKDKRLVFQGTPLNFLGTILLGIILSAFTLGIYLAWFTRDIVRFFVNNTSYDSENMEFRGKGLDLFIILLATLLVPFILLIGFAIKYATEMANLSFAERYLFQFIQYLILLPYMYFSYKWTVNIKVKNYIINWRTEALPSIGKMALEISLTFLTFVIYMPAAILKLYKYFMDRTVADDGTQQRKFGFDLELKKDFLLLWKEMLLSMVTLGLYFPWAFCNINKAIFGKTYIESGINDTEVPDSQQL